jgi:hypothetical protein
MRNIIVVAIASLGVAACANMQELQFAPNMVRLDVDSPSAPFVGEAVLKRAAEITLQNGYSAFRLTPIYALTFDRLGLTVVMFHAGDPGSMNAFDAVEILKKYP